MEYSEEIPRVPTFFDEKIFDVDLNKKRNVKIISIDENLRVIEVPDVYMDYIAVRQFALALPCMPANEVNPYTAYPGWRGAAHLYTVMSGLWNLISTLLDEYFFAEWDTERHAIRFPFQTGIISTKHIVKRVNAKSKHEYGGFMPHTDQSIDSYGQFAGLIYLNLPDETAGGTDFYKGEVTDPILHYKIDMKPNTLLLYQKRVLHQPSISRNDFKEHYRITQTFFIP